MANVYDVPENFNPAPDFMTFMTAGRYDHDKATAAEQEWVAKLAKWCRQRVTGQDLVGEVVRFQIADGYAEYMVASQRPLDLIHLPLGDAWEIPAAHMRGLRVSDIRQQVEQRRRLDALFAERKAQTR